MPLVPRKPHGLLRKKQKYSTLGPDGETKQSDSRRRKQKPEESPAGAHLLVSEEAEAGYDLGEVQFAEMPSDRRSSNMEVRRLQEQILSLETEIDALEEDNNTLAQKVNSYAAQAQKLINENRQLTLKSKNIIVHNPYEEDLKQCRLTIEQQNKEIASLKSAKASSVPSAVDDQYVKDLESRIAEQKQVFEKEMADLRAENNAFENELLLRQQLMTSGREESGAISALNEKLQQEIERLQNENECLRDEIEECKEKEGSMQKLISDKDFEISGLQTELQEAKTALAASELGVEQMKDEMVELRKVGAAAAKASEMESQVFMLTTELEEKTEESNKLEERLKKTLASVSFEVDANAAEKKGLQLEVDRLKEEGEQKLAEIREKFASLEASLEVEKKMVAELKTKVETLTQTNAKLQEENSQLSSQFEEKSAQMKSLETKLDQEKSAKLDAGAELTTQLEALTQTNAKLQEENSQLSSQFEEKSAQIQALETQLNQEKTAKSDAGGEIQILRAENVDLQAKCQELTQNLTARDGEVEEAGKMKSTLEAQLEEEKSARNEESARLKNEMEDLKVQLLSLEAQNNEMKAQSESRDALQAEKGKLESELKTRADAVLRLGKEVDDLQSKLDAAGQQISELQDTNAGLVTENTSISTERKELQFMVSELEEKLKAIDLEKGKRILESENLNLKKQNQRLSHELEKRESSTQEMEQQISVLKRLNSGDSETLHTSV